MSKKAITKYEENNPFLVVVDIQPSYHPGSHHVVPDVIEKLNNTKQQIIYFYVGKEFDLDSKEDVVFYLLENGLEESRIDDIKFIEKTYGYYRGWMDTGVPEDVIVRAIKEMESNKIVDCRDFEETHWANVIGEDDIEQYILEENPIHSMNLDVDMSIFHLDNLNNLELIGGGRQECLKELELYLKAINKDFVINEKLCYGDNYFSYQNDYKSLKKMKVI